MTQFHQTALAVLELDQNMNNQFYKPKRLSSIWQVEILNLSMLFRANIRNDVWPSPGAGCLIPTETFKRKRLHLLVIYFLKKMKKPLVPTKKSIAPVSNYESFKSSNGNILKAITTFIIRVLYLPLTTGCSECHLIPYFDDPVHHVTEM